MAKLSFDIKANYDKVVELRKEINHLEKALNKVNANTPKEEIESLEGKLATARGEFKSLTQAAMEAGVKLDTEWKTKLRTASLALKEVEDRIKNQKDVLASAEERVRRFSDAYAQAANSGRGVTMAKRDLDEATEALEREREALEQLNDEQVKAQGIVDKLEGEYDSFKNKTDVMTQAFMKMSAALGGMSALKNLMSQIVQVRAEFQDMEVQIETLVGKDMTAKLMPQIKEMAKTSPLTMTDIVGAEKTMLSFNIEAEKTIDYLRALSDVSMGNSQKFNSLTLAFSQVSSAGKLMGQDLLQMINAGFNPLQQMAKTTGKTISELKDEMSKGLITAEMVQQAFIDATKEGGQFYNMSANASQTINGQISMMEDAWAAALNEIGEQSEGLIMGGIQALTLLIQNYEKVGKAIITLVSIYGAYKAAVITTVTVEKIANSFKTGAIAKTGLYTLAVEKLKNAFVKLKAVQTSTWIGLAAAGITAVIGTLWTFSETTDAATEAQEAFNQAQADATNATQAHKEKVDALIATVNDEAKATQERTKALNDLKKEYPEIFNQYDIETMKLADMLEIKKEINKVDRENEKLEAKGRAEASIKNVNAKLATLKNKDKYFESYATDEEIEAAKKYRDKTVRAYIDNYVLPDLATAMRELSPEDLSGIVAGTLGFQGGDWDTYSKYATETQKKEIKNIAQRELDSRKEKPNYGERYKEAEKAWKEAQALFDDMQKNKDKYTDEQYFEQKKVLKKAKEEYENRGGDTSKKVKTKSETDYAAQEAKARKDAAKTAAREQIELDNQLEQARIDSLEAGAEKREAQIALNNKKELQQITRSQEDFVSAYVSRQKAIFDAEENAKAAKYSNYKKKKFDFDAAEEAAKATEEYEKYDMLYVQAEARQNAEIAQQAREDWREYVKDYGNYKDKVLAITEEYNEKIANAENEWQKKSLEAERDKVLKDLELSKDAAYQNIFKDPSKMTSAAINNAITLAKTKIKEILGSGDVSDDQLESVKTLQEAIDKLTSFNASIFSQYGGGLDGIIKKLNQLGEAQSKMELAKAIGDEEAYEAAKMEVDATKEALGRNLKGAAVQGTVKALGMVSDSIREIAKITESMELETLADSMDAVASSMSAAVQGFISGGAIGLVLNLALDAVMKLFTALTDFVAFGLQNTKAIEEYAKELGMLSLSVDEEKFESIFGEDKWGKIRDAGDAWRAAAEKLKEVGQIDLLKSFNSSVGGAKAMVESVAKNGGTTSSLGNMWVQAKGVGKKKNSGFLNEMFPEIFDKDGNLNPEKIEEAKLALETLKNMKLADDSAVKALEDNIAVAEKLKENADLLKEAASDYMGNLAQTLGDVLVNSILRGEDAMDQLGATGAEIITQLGNDLARTWVLNTYLKQYEDRMTKAFQTGNQNEIADVVGDIVEGFPAMMKTGAELVTALYDTTKGTEYDVYEHAKEQQEQEASKKGYETLSEETGNKLEARALAQYESNLRIESSQREQTTSVLEMKSTLYAMLGQQYAIGNIADDCRRILAETQIDVRAILNNTDAMVKPIANLSAKMDKWDSKIMSL